MKNALDQICWHSDALGDCMAVLVRRCRLADSQRIEALPRFAGDVRTYMARAAERLNCEVEKIDIYLGELETALPAAVPGIVQLGPRHFIAIISANKRKLTVLTPELRLRKIPVTDLCRALREPTAAKHRVNIRTDLQSAQLGQNEDAAVEAILLERIRLIPLDGCWVLRPSPGAGLLLWLRQAAVVRNAIRLVVVHLAQYLVWLVAWSVLGRLSLTGHVDRGSLLGWGLLIATAIPFQLAAGWLQGLVAVGTGGLLKKRLLSGALKLRPDEIRHAGIGTFLAQALEAEAIEQLALGGGIAGVLSVLDLAVAGVLLGRYALLLAFWIVVTGVCGVRFFAVFSKWRAARFQITGLTIESMLGHRTRLAQQSPQEWHDREDRDLNAYHLVSADLDRSGAVLNSVIPRGWLTLGLASLAPLLLSGSQSTSQIAVLIGATLLAYSAFAQFAASLSEGITAAVAWKSVAPLFKAASRESDDCAVLETPPIGASVKVLDAERLTFSYRQQGKPVLDGVSLSVHAGDRILLEGPSGGGKTTLASVIAGFRDPDSGLLLSGGLDRSTLGSSGWADRVVAVPQFHENHILTETLAFNLLLGRPWPPTSDDLKAADEICRHLGLGDLLDRMPNGVLQMVGEGGWQLSHGEKSRIFMARALLRNSALLIMDESFGALDPENTEQCLRFALERANALMVIAHP